MKSLVVSASVVLFAASLGAGCPGPAEGEGEGEGEGGGVATANDVANALDDYLDRCGPQILGFTAQKEPVLSGILAGQLRSLLDSDFAGEAGDPNVTFDAAAGAKCVDELKALACGDVTTLDSGAADCAATFVGKLAEGALCADDDECVSGSDCKGLNKEQSTCGTCTAEVTNVGGDCSNADCSEDLICVNDTCQTPPADVTFHAGDPCPDFDCGDASLVCDQTQHCATVTVVQVGDTCDTAGVHYCVDTATKNFCDPTTTQCTARPGLNGDCSTFPLCDATVAACDQATGTCVAAKVEGAACAQTSDCAAGLTCDATCGPQVTAPANPSCN